MLCQYYIYKQQDVCHLSSEMTDLCVLSLPFAWSQRIDNCFICNQKKSVKYLNIGVGRFLWSNSSWVHFNFFSCLQRMKDSLVHNQWICNDKKSCWKPCEHLMWIQQFVCTSIWLEPPASILQNIYKSFVKWASAIIIGSCETHKNIFSLLWQLK